MFSNYKIHLILTFYEYLAGSISGFIINGLSRFIFSNKNSLFMLILSITLFTIPIMAVFNYLRVNENSWKYLPGLQNKDNTEILKSHAPVAFVIGFWNTQKFADDRIKLITTRIHNYFFR